MALSFAKPRAQDGGAPMADMNTTPLIDVMLVLLIMFIITIPIQTHSVSVNLPAPAEVPISPPPVNPVKNHIALGADDTIFWNGRAIDRLTLRQYLAASLRTPVEPELQFQPDAAARYVIVDEVLAEIRRSGVTKLGFVGNERYAAF